MVKLSEEEWAVCRDDAATLLEHLGYSGWHTTRKFRLFCCAAARRVAHLTELNGEELLRVAEADADGVADPADLAKALARVEEYVRPTNNRLRRRRHGRFKAQRWRWNAVYAILLALAPSKQANEWRSSVCIAGLETWPPDEPSVAELSARVDLVRDIFEDPFRPPSQRIDPRRLSGTAVALARGIAADQAFDRLPILADALEESGCDDPAVLGHCRGCSPHVRGCWVIDLVLRLGVALYAEPVAAPDPARGSVSGTCRPSSGPGR
ncbi:MAG: hypothetical protein JWO38_552 [Gemmataceae bacterium]|nr:hypothetical protein [Gemmataceae bacterium]